MGGGCLDSIGITCPPGDPAYSFFCPVGDAGRTPDDPPLDLARAGGELGEVADLARASDDLGAADDRYDMGAPDLLEQGEADLAMDSPDLAVELRDLAAAIDDLAEPIDLAEPADDLAAPVDLAVPVVDMAGPEHHDLAPPDFARPPDLLSCMANCPKGCCDANGVCQPQGPAACGTLGGMCVACAQGQACVAGVCQCNAQSCASGCCSNNACVQPTPLLCGIKGVVCVKCAQGQLCALGLCL